jgi:hypothetical protein
MRPAKTHSVRMNLWSLAAVAALAISFAAGCSSTKKSTEAPAGEQTSFATPEEAGKALLAASQSGDANKLAQILGPGSQPIVTSGDPNEDKAGLQSFVEKYNRMNRWALLNDGSEVLYIGADNYPFPVRVKKDASSRWRFDGASGADEILTRRIGKNELLAIDAISAMANAQEIYYKTGHDGNPAHVYAQQLISTSGKHDGLYWPSSDEKDASPLGKVEEFAPDAVAAAASGKQPELDGYYILVLTGQGDKAKGGARSYLANGKLTGGFAFIAYPVKHGDSGIMTFLLSREGTVYQKDLGDQTAALAAAPKEYNPTDGWVPAE